jgi:hypothetical protein
MISGPQGKALADSLNITQEQLRARFLADPQGVGGMIQNFAAPTEATKNYNQARAQMKAQGMTDEQINAVMPPEMLALGGGVSTPDYREFVLARTRAIQSGQPLPPELQDYPTYQASKAAKAKLMGDQANDLAESQAKFGDQVAKMNEVERITNSVQNATDADGTTPVLKAILDSPTKKAAAASLLASGEPGALRSAGNAMGLPADAGREDRYRKPEAIDCVHLRHRFHFNGLEAHPAGGGEYRVQPQPAWQLEPAVRELQHFAEQSS